MPDTTDRFIQGVSLGQRARQIDNQEDQFRTNLAERARQSNRQFDLDRESLDAQVSRNNAYVSKLQYDMKQQKLEDDLSSSQTKLLQDWNLSASEAATSDGFQSIPFPPAALVGDARIQAMNTHNQFMGARKENAAYKAKIQQDEMEAELYQYGLHPEHFNLPDNSSGSMRSALDRRNTDVFRQVAGELGIKLDRIDSADLDRFSDSRGMLIREQVAAFLAPGGSQIVTPTAGGGRLSTSTPLTGLQEIKRAVATREKAQAKFVTDNAVDELGEARDPSAIRDLVLAAFPPAGKLPGGKPIYIGTSYVDPDDGARFVFRGGDSNDTANWIEDR